MPSDQELKSYAEKLPPIYREILMAFPRIEPARKLGYGLAFQTLAADFEARNVGFSLGEVIQACEQLEQHGIVETKHRIYVHPTEYGERLIAALTGQSAKPAAVPALPTPPS